MGAPSSSDSVHRDVVHGGGDVTDKITRSSCLPTELVIGCPYTYETKLQRIDYRGRMGNLSRLCHISARYEVYRSLV